MGMPKYKLSLILIFWYMKYGKIEILFYQHTGKYGSEKARIWVYISRSITLVFLLLTLNKKLTPGMSLPEVWKTEREVERLTNIDQSIVSFVNRVLSDICFTEKHIARVLIHFEK